MRKLVWFTLVIIAVSLCASSGFAENKVQTAPNANDELMARAAKLYYSTAKSGLDGFDCAVHPDWHTLFVSANKGSAVAADDPRILLLKPVNITIHARLKGGSTLSWNVPTHPGKPLDPDSTTYLDSMHRATEQTLMGFLQFWTPFVDGSAVPASSKGLEITRIENGYRLHAEESDTSVTEVLDSNLLLKQFDVIMKEGMNVKFSPSYKSTERGLLVVGFLARILPAGAPPEQTQEMHVEIEYQLLEGLTIPAKLNMSVVNVGVFNFVFDGCQVIPKK